MIIRHGYRGPLQVPAELRCKPVVYVLYEGETPIYVGQTMNLSNRLRAHRAPESRTAAHDHWEAHLVGDRTEALALESELIATLDPTLNVAR